MATEPSLGQAVWIDGMGGRQLAVFIRRNRNGKAVIQKVYYNLGADQPVGEVVPTGPGKHQQVADAIAIAMAADKHRG